MKLWRTIVFGNSSVVRRKGIALIAEQAVPSLCAEIDGTEKKRRLNNKKNR
jgi:hypothetical protein